MIDSTAGGQPNPPADPAAGGSVPKELWKFGLAFSLLLIVVGLAVMALNEQLFSIGALSFCAGLGITLTIFGTIAGGRFLDINVVGGGAMAIVLFLLLVYYPIEPADRYLLGEIYETSKLKNVRGHGKHVFLTGRNEENGNFRFFAFEKELGDGLVRFNFDFPEGGKQKEFFINCINAKELKASNSKRDTLSLTLVEGDGGRFRLTETASGREIGRMNEQYCNLPAAKPTIGREVGFLDTLSIAAYAQQSAPVNIPKAVSLLESDDGDLRDHARDQIASLRGAKDYEVVAGSWKVTESSYRGDLGRLVAWSSAIVQDRATAVTLAEALSPAQMRYLVQLTGQGDITLRQFATEVLHRLLETTSWPNGPSADRAREIISATLAVLRSPRPEPLRKPSAQFSSSNQLYNTVVAIGFAGCNIGASYRLTVVEALSALASEFRSADESPRTEAKLAQVIAALKECR